MRMSVLVVDAVEIVLVAAVVVPVVGALTEIEVPGSTALGMESLVERECVVQTVYEFSPS